MTISNYFGQECSSTVLKLTLIMMTKHKRRFSENWLCSSYSDKWLLLPAGVKAFGMRSEIL